MGVVSTRPHRLRSCRCSDDRLRLRPPAPPDRRTAPQGLRLAFTVRLAKTATSGSRTDSPGIRRDVIQRADYTEERSYRSAQTGGFDAAGGDVMADSRPAPAESFAEVILSLAAELIEVVGHPGQTALDPRPTSISAACVPDVYLRTSPTKVSFPPHDDKPCGTSDPVQSRRFAARRSSRGRRRGACSSCIWRPPSGVSSGHAAASQAEVSAGRSGHRCRGAQGAGISGGGRR